MDPNAQPFLPQQPQPLNPNAQPFVPQPQPPNPNAQPFVPQPQPFNPNAQPFAPQVQPLNPNAQPFIPQPQPLNPNAQPFVPQPQPLNPNAQPFVPQQQVPGANIPQQQQQVFPYPNIPNGAPVNPAAIAQIINLPPSPNGYQVVRPWHQAFEVWAATRGFNNGFVAHFNVQTPNGPMLHVYYNGFGQLQVAGPGQTPNGY